MLTHTGGFVSAQYLSNCKAHGVDVSSIAKGDKLEVDSNYYSDAVNLVSEIGMKLCHVLWRKFSQEQRAEADSDLNALGYDLIHSRQYALAESILFFGVHVLKKHAQEKTKRMMVINLANAIRLQDRTKEAKRLVDKEDWSAASSEFQVCAAAAAAGDKNQLLKLMEVIGTSVKPEEYRTWPVFRGHRTETQFMAAFEALFDEPLLSDETLNTIQSPKTMDDDPG